MILSRKIWGILKSFCKESRRSSWRKSRSNIWMNSSKNSCWGYLRVRLLDRCYRLENFTWEPRTDKLNFGIIEDTPVEIPGRVQKVQGARLYSLWCAISEGFSERISRKKIWRNFNIFFWDRKSKDFFFKISCYFQNSSRGFFQQLLVGLIQDSEKEIFIEIPSRIRIHIIIPHFVTTDFIKNSSGNCSRSLFQKLHLRIIPSTSSIDP